MQQKGAYEKWLEQWLQRQETIVTQMKQTKKNLYRMIDTYLPVPNHSYNTRGLHNNKKLQKSQRQLESTIHSERIKLGRLTHQWLFPTERDILPCLLMTLVPYVPVRDLINLISDYLLVRNNSVFQLV